MVKFNQITLSNTEPNIQSLWLKPNKEVVDFYIYNGG